QDIFCLLPKPAQRALPEAHMFFDKTEKNGKRKDGSHDRDQAVERAQPVIDAEKTPGVQILQKLRPRLPRKKTIPHRMDTIIVERQRQKDCRHEGKRQQKQDIFEKVFPAFKYGTHKHPSVDYYITKPAPCKEILKIFPLPRAK